MKIPKQHKDENDNQFITRACHTYFSNGYNVDEIAKRLKVDVKEIYCHLTNTSTDTIVTDKERTLILQLYHTGYSIKDIAAITNRSENTIRNRIKSPAKCPTKSKVMLTDNELDCIKTQYLYGLSLSEIGRLIGISHQRVRYRLCKMGLITESKPVKRVTKKDIKTIKMLAKKGLNITQIAEEVGFSRTTVRKYL